MCTDVGLVLFPVDKDSVTLASLQTPPAGRSCTVSHVPESVLLYSCQEISTLGLAEATVQVKGSAVFSVTSVGGWDIVAADGRTVK